MVGARRAPDWSRRTRLRSQENAEISEFDKALKKQRSNPNVLDRRASKNSCEPRSAVYQRVERLQKSAEVLICNTSRPASADARYGFRRGGFVAARGNLTQTRSNRSPAQSDSSKKSLLSTKKLASPACSPSETPEREVRRSEALVRTPDFVRSPARDEKSSSASPMRSTGQQHVLADATDCNDPEGRRLLSRQASVSALPPAPDPLTTSPEEPVASSGERPPVSLDKWRADIIRQFVEEHHRRCADSICRDIQSETCPITPEAVSPVASHTPLKLSPVASQHPRGVLCPGGPGAATGWPKPREASQRLARSISPVARSAVQSLLPPKRSASPVSANLAANVAHVAATPTLALIKPPPRLTSAVGGAAGSRCIAASGAECIKTNHKCVNVSPRWNATWRAGIT